MTKDPLGWGYPAGAEHDPRAPWNYIEPGCEVCEQPEDCCECRVCACCNNLSRFCITCQGCYSSVCDGCCFDETSCDNCAGESQE